jgi:large subunit ribosomal protein L21
VPDVYALIETGGKQYKIQEGDILSVEKLGADEGEKVSFDKVLLIGGEEGIKVGKPYVEGAAVEGEVLFHGKGKKIIVFKYKAKKNYRKKQGHRQPFSRVKITKISG